LVPSPLQSKALCVVAEETLFKPLFLPASSLLLGIFLLKFYLFNLSFVRFTDERVFLQTVPNPLADPLAAVGDLINQRDLVFQVWPKLSCEAHKQMRKLKKERDLLNGDSDDEEKE